MIYIKMNQQSTNKNKISTQIFQFKVTNYNLVTP